MHACKLSCGYVWVFAPPWTVAHKSPLSMGFFWQKYCSALPFPPPGDLPDPGVKPHPLCLLDWWVDSSLLSHLESPKYHQLGGLSNKHLFLTVSGIAESRIKAQADWVSREGPLPGCKRLTFPCPHIEDRRGKAALWGLLHQGTNPIHEQSTSWPSHLPHLPKASLCWGLSFNTQMLREQTFSLYY